MPVIKDVQAGWVRGGVVERNGAANPVSTNCLRCGMYPLSISGFSASNKLIDEFELDEIYHIQKIKRKGKLQNDEY